MKAWSVSDAECPEHGATLVFADSREKARAIGIVELDIDYIDAHAKLLETPVPEGACDRLATARECRAAGWAHEDEEACASCGFYPNGLDEYEVCEVCHGCKDCGCDKEEHDAV